ncbi:MOSC domain-containing protein [Kocuria oceani]|uniref:MOSC domain-containing protein n=1 Tax=Kocuria oceani TaxID=988827 RepID=UPI0040358F5D
MTARVRSVNVGRAEENPARSALPTGIRKRPVAGPVAIREPGPRRGGLGSGVAGDFIGNSTHHGGTDQAVYAFAREELDFWAHELGRELPDGSFGENLTLAGFDVDDARLGDVWRIGDVLLQVTDARIPCGTFRGVMEVRGWLRRFTERGRSGAYLKVLSPGAVRAGQAVDLVRRAEHGVGVTDAFRAQTTERERLPELLQAGEDLCEQLRRRIEKERRAEARRAQRRGVS